MENHLALRHKLADNALAKGARRANLTLAEQIVWAWIFTIACAGFLAFVFLHLLTFFGASAE